MAYIINRKTIEFVPDWNKNKKSDNPIKIHFNPLSIDCYCELIDIAQKARENTETGKIKDFSVMGKLALRMLPVFKKNITKIENITNGNRIIIIEELVESPEFIELNSEIMNEMIIRATITQDDKKK
jgi:hypothetical protein